MISLTPLIPRTAASTRRVIWISSSGGAAPGWLIETVAAGELMSGLRFTSIRMNAIRPMASKEDEQDERNDRVADRPGRDVTAHDLAPVRSSPILARAARRDALGPDALARIEEGAGRFDHPLVAVQALGDDDAAIGDRADAARARAATVLFGPMIIT